MFKFQIGDSVDLGNFIYMNTDCKIIDYFGRDGFVVRVWKESKHVADVCVDKDELEVA